MNSASLLRAVRDLARGALHPGWCPICGPTLLHKQGPWLREDYVCRRCRSTSRQRALVTVLRRVVPDLATKRVFESSPGSASSDWLRRTCPQYMPSQYFADVPRGEVGPGGARSEDLAALTLPEASVDVVITQDVFEHVLDPDAAWREIARVLTPGGVHVWTVPVFPRATTLVRARPGADGGVEHVEPPDYHGNPLGGGSLVVHEWGEDLLARVDDVSRMVTTRYQPSSRWRGIAGPMRDVLVSQKRA